jgi:hypothetical protein
MEIQDEKMIEIFYTLENIQRMNKAILFHSDSENIDTFAINQYENLKNDFLNQLATLLNGLGVPLQIAQNSYKQAA